MFKPYKVLLLVLVSAFLCVVNIKAQTPHPNIYALQSDKADILNKIKQQEWARASWERILQDIDPYVNQHVSDPQWIISRLAMYWKKGEHFTQCYLKNETWDYGTGDAPVPTVRLPGMRVWNDYSNVPLPDRIPYNESGDMKAVSNVHPAEGVVLVPYKKSGHLIRANNSEILTLAEKAAFVYWLTGQEKYASFAADIYNTWLVGTYYMNPILDPGKSSGGFGGYQPGGILGFYDYEQIHDELSTHAAVIYDFLTAYLEKHSSEPIRATGKSLKEITGSVFKKFIDIGMVRGGKTGNWNVNGWDMMMPAILALEPNGFYPDGHGKAYYLHFFTTESTAYHSSLPDILKEYDPVTGLWPESPGYASGTISSLLNISLMLYKSGINTIAGNPMMQKAALAIFPWLDARGNLVNFGDGRGGPGDFTRFEHLATYYDWMNDAQNAQVVIAALQMGIDNKQYSRLGAGWKGICFNLARLPEGKVRVPFARSAYSTIHRHMILKNENDTINGMMFTLYGGYPKQKHLSPNGLAMQLYGKGWALAPDASGYESYWSADYAYHQAATGSNTILPGYTSGPVQVNAIDPAIGSSDFTNKNITSLSCSFADVSAGEKRRLVAMVRTSPATGYYIDIFRSDQPDNDYLYHNLGNELLLSDSLKRAIVLRKDSLVNGDIPGYKYFRNITSADLSGALLATWTITKIKPRIVMDMWMAYAPGRKVYRVEAPYTTITNKVTPGEVNKAPDSTPAVIVRQNGQNGWQHPFIAVFEPHNEGEKAISSISSLSSQKDFNGLLVESKKLNQSRQYILNALDSNNHSIQNRINFKGSFGVISENSSGLEYLYLGKGLLIQSGPYKIESGKNAAAEIKTENGAWLYSADRWIVVTLPLPPGQGKKTLQYWKNGKYQDAGGKVDQKNHTLTAKLPEGYGVPMRFK